jgi:hypothetical protein
VLRTRAVNENITTSTAQQAGEMRQEM